MPLALAPPVLPVLQMLFVMQVLRDAAIPSLANAQQQSVVESQHCGQRQGQHGGIQVLGNTEGRLLWLVAVLCIRVCV